MQNLTNTIVSNITPTDAERTISDNKVTGLKVRVGVSGTKTFYLFYKKAGKQKKYRIGKFGDIGVPAAREVAKKLKAKIALNEDPQADKINERKELSRKQVSSLRKFLDGKYYPWIETSQRSSKRTKQILEFNFNGFMTRDMSTITSGEVDKWQQDRLASGVKPSTINRALNAFKAVLGKAVDWEIVQENPIAGRKKLKVDTRGVIRYLSDKEETRLLEVLPTRESEHIKLLVPLLLNTGARPTEALTLSWSDVDLKQRRITLHAAFTKTGQTRHIPINDKLAEVLSMQKSKVGFLFPSADPTKPVVTVQKAWRNLKKAAKLTNFRLYDCRHTFASKLVMRGVDLYTVSELLGHSSVEMTKIYAHLAPEHLKSAVDVL